MKNEQVRIEMCINSFSTIHVSIRGFGMVPRGPTTYRYVIGSAELNSISNVVRQKLFNYKRIRIGGFGSAKGFGSADSDRRKTNLAICYDSAKIHNKGRCISGTFGST